MKKIQKLMNNKLYKIIKNQLHLRKSLLYGKESKIANWEELFHMYLKLELELNCQMLYQKVEEKNKYKNIARNIEYELAIYQ